MASNPDVFLQGLIGTTGLRPIQEAEQGQQQLALGQQQVQSNQLALNAAQQQAAQQAQFQHDTQQYFANPSPANLAALVKKYPQQAEQLQKTYDVLDAPAKQSRVQQLGALYNAAKNGRPELVTKTMQSIIDAEKAQGIDTSDAEDALAAVNAGDPKALNYVTAFAQAHLAAADKDFAKSLGVGADQKNFASTGDSAIYDQRTGEVVRQAPPKPIYKTVDVFDGDGNKVGTQVIEIQPGGGGQASTASGGTTTAPGTGPRSVRNNNPGNIRGVNKEGQPIGWVQKLPGYSGVDDKGYAVFADSSNGQGAQQALLGRYMAGGRRTVSSIIEKWAPRISNGGDNTDAQVNNYIASVAKQLNVNPNDALTPAVIPRLAAAMAQFESGGKGGTTRSGVPNTAQPQPGARTVYSSVGNKPPEAMSPAAIDNAAQIYNKFGTLPPSLGRGGKIQQQILTRAAELAGGTDVGTMMADRASNKADMGALTSLQRTASQVLAFEDTANQNGMLALRKFQALDNGNVPIFNAWVNAGRRATGNAKVAEANAANEAFVTEYAKVVSGATGGAVTSDSARQHARDLISTADSPAAYAGVIHTLQEEMANRRVGLENQRKELLKRISGGGTGQQGAPGASHDNPIPVRSPQEAAGKHGQWVRLPDGRVGRVK